MATGIEEIKSNARKTEFFAELTFGTFAPDGGLCKYQYVQDKSIFHAKLGTGLRYNLLAYLAKQGEPRRFSKTGIAEVFSLLQDFIYWKSCPLTLPV